MADVPPIRDLAEMLRVYLGPFGSPIAAVVVILAAAAAMVWFGNAIAKGIAPGWDGFFPSDPTKKRRPKAFIATVVVIAAVVLVPTYWSSRQTPVASRPETNSASNALIPPTSEPNAILVDCRERVLPATSDGSTRYWVLVLPLPSIDMPGGFNSSLSPPGYTAGWGETPQVVTYGDECDVSDIGDESLSSVEIISRIDFAHLPKSGPIVPYFSRNYAFTIPDLLPRRGDKFTFYIVNGSGDEVQFAFPDGAKAIVGPEAVMAQIKVIWPHERDIYLEPSPHPVQIRPPRNKSAATL